MFSSRAFLVTFESIMGGILILEIDTWVKILTLIVAGVVGWYSVKANKAKAKLDGVQSEIKQQELYKLMLEAKEREAKLTKLKEDESN